MTNTDRFVEIRARAEAATAGPWGLYEGGGFMDIAADLQETGSGYSARRQIVSFDEEPLDNDPAHRDWTAEEDWAQVQADAEFITHARDDVPTLLAEIDHLRDEAAREDGEQTTLIDERDHLHEVADKLAYAIAPAEVIGEHSSGNDPWENALEHITPFGEADRLRAEIKQLKQELSSAAATITEQHQQLVAREREHNADREELHALRARPSRDAAQTGGAE